MKRFSGVFKLAFLLMNAFIFAGGGNVLPGSINRSAAFAESCSSTNCSRPKEGDKCTCSTSGCDGCYVVGGESGCGRCSSGC